MHDIDLRLAMSAAIRAQGRRSCHPDDIRAAQAAADGIIEYLRREEFVIVSKSDASRRELVPLNEGYD
jgi:hypothetical protein